MATIDTIADRSTGTALAGKAYFETSTNKFIVYNGSAWIEIDSDGTGAVPFENRWGASFDGSNDTLSVSDSSLDLKTDFSISCWFNRGSGVASWDALVSWGEASDGKYRAFGFNANNNLTFNAHGRGFNSSGQTLSNSTWYHGVLTLSGTGSNAVAKVYVNGSLDSTVTVALVDYSTYAGQLFGASTYDGVERFEGAMDDLAIFDSVLDQTAITALYGGGTPTDLSSLNPVGYWRMGDDSNDTASAGGSIATITDSSGNGNDATQATASSQPTFKALAQSTTSLSFDGSNDYLEVPHSTDLELTTAMTWSAWVNMNTTQTVDYPYIFAKWNSGNTAANYTFYTHTESAVAGIPAGHFVMRYYDGSNGQSSNTLIPRGQWVHLAGVHNGTQLTYYVNGVADNTINVTTGSTNTGNLIIGRAPNGVRTFPGEIDEAAIFNSALSASDVASLASSRGAHVVNDLSLSPTAYYRMGEDDSLADGASVSQITDASGNGNHATQATAANQPTASIDPVIYV